MRALALSRYAITSGVAAALLTGCGGSSAPALDPQAVRALTIVEHLRRVKPIDPQILSVDSDGRPVSIGDGDWTVEAEKDSGDFAEHWYCPNEYVITYHAEGQENEYWIVSPASGRIHRPIVDPDSQAIEEPRDNGRIPLCDDGKPPVDDNE